MVKAMEAGKLAVSELCRRLGIAEKTAYKWRNRFRLGRLRGLEDRSTRPARVPGRTAQRWLERLRGLRTRRPTWGVRKLRHRLGTQFGQTGLPCLSTLGRWLKRWGLVRGKRRRHCGPVILRAMVKPARYCNDVWTVDFKGWDRTGDGTRVDPLTVRDLYSRYGLRVVILPGQSVIPARREFVKLFHRYGLPRRIRSDNGVPFGGGGPTGLTRLSAWWIKLGIEVEFTTPGRPCENGAHEQFHRVYKTEVARHPAWSRAGQQRRSNLWLKYYNEQRPHEALAMAVPASRYRKSKRSLPTGTKPWTYPARWVRRWVKGNGEIIWRGTPRFVGESFVGDYVGLRPKGRRVWTVYFGPVVVGELHEEEKGNIRTAKYRHRK